MRALVRLPAQEGVEQGVDEIWGAHTCARLICATRKDSSSGAMVDE